MFKAVFAHIAALVSLMLSACAGERPAPDTPPTLDTAPAPRQDSAAKFAVYETERLFGLPRDELVAWLATDPSGSDTGFGRIVAAMEETPRIKKPVRSTALEGQWPEDGAVRRLTFSDGHHVLERVLANELPERFAYQVWGYTTSAGRNLDYAIGEQRFEALSDGRTRMVWTYSLKPDAGFKRPFVQRFVDEDMRPLMDEALDRVMAQSAKVPS